MQELEKDLVTTKEAMKMLRCGRTSLWKLTKAGAFAVYKLSPRSTFYSAASIRDYIARNKTEAKDIL